jgi:hypothetical protein
MDTLSDEQKYKAMRYWWLCYIGYARKDPRSIKVCAVLTVCDVVAMVTSKVSIGLFLLRVTIKPIHKWIIYAAMTVSVFTGGVFFFVTVFQCTPIRYALTESLHLRLLTEHQVSSGISNSKAIAFLSMSLSPSLSFTVHARSFRTSRSPFCPFS